MDFSKNVQKRDEFLSEVGKELGAVYKLNAGRRLVRSVFQVLRDILSMEESLQFIAQLPIALKSLYIDGWNNHESKKRIQTMDDFITAVVMEGRPGGYNDFSSKKEGIYAMETVFKVLKKHLSQGEIENIQALLPKRPPGTL
jgi:uncharacterized protein (DUF2267 family)